MPHISTARPIVPKIEEGAFTELQHRNDDRMRGVLGEFGFTPEQTVPYDLSRGELFDRIDTLVGNTPLLHVEDVGDSHIVAKVESQNPTENHYDRVFPRTIQKLEKDGVIEPGDELIEVTSGSGGRAFAWAARVLGYKAHILIPPELPKARVQDMINFGAEIEVTEPGYMSTVSEAYGKRIKEYEEDGWEVTPHKTKDYNVRTAVKDGKRVCFVNHSANEITIEGFESIGNEIHDQMPEDEKVDYVVSVMGNGTSTAALSRSMRRHYPGVTIVGLEDERSPFYFEQMYPGEYERRFGKPLEFSEHDMYGSSAPGVNLKYGNVDAVDEVRLANPTVRDEAKDAYNHGQPGYEQIGNSSAASLVAARQLAAEHPGNNIAIVFYDKADQYGEQPTLAPRTKFLHDRFRPGGVPPKGWHQRHAGTIALLPESIHAAYTRS